MKRKSFTLIEILGVIAIIAILSTLGFAGYSYASNKSKEAATEGLLTRLNAAFEIAHQKTGFLPHAADFEAIKILYSSGVISGLEIGAEKWLLSDTSNRDAKKKALFCKQFIQALQMDSMNRYLEDGYIIDAWGTKVYYIYPGLFKTGGFDLISAGSYGIFGADDGDDDDDDDDKPEKDVSKYRDGAEWICDDITNI